MKARPIYAALAILGTLVPYAVFLPWLSDHGLAPGLFLSAMFATDISTFFSLDVLISAVVVIVATIGTADLSTGKKAGVISATCLIGVSAGLPLLIYLTTERKAV